MSPHHSSHAPHGVAERHLFGTCDRDGLTRKPSFHEAGGQHACHILNRDGPDGPILDPHQGEHRKRAQGVAQVIEHMIAPSVNDPGFEHGVVEPGGSDDLLGRPLRLVIRRAAIRPSPKKAEQSNLPHSNRLRGSDDVASSLNMNVLIRLTAFLTIDARAMSHGVASGQGLGEFIFVIRPDGEKVRPAQLADASVATIDAAGDKDYFVAIAGEGPGEMSSDKPGSTRDPDLHCALPDSRFNSSELLAFLSAKEEPPGLPRMFISQSPAR